MTRHHNALTFERERAVAAIEGHCLLHDARLIPGEAGWAVCPVSGYRIHASATDDAITVRTDFGEYRFVTERVRT